MAIDPELVARYTQLEDGELLARRAREGLTTEAYEAIDAVIASRGIDSSCALESRAFQGAKDNKKTNVDLSSAERFHRWMSTMLAAIILGPIVLILFLYAISYEPSESAIELQALVILWFGAIATYYVLIFKTARALEYSPWVCLLVAVFLKIIGWLIVHGALTWELRRQQKLLVDDS